MVRVGSGVPVTGSIMIGLLECERPAFWAGRLVWCEFYRLRKKSTSDVFWPSSSGRG